MLSTSCTRLMPSTVTKKRRPAENARGMKTQLLVRLPMTWAGCGGAGAGTGELLRRVVLAVSCYSACNQRW